MRFKVEACLIALIALSMTCRAQSSTADERGLWALWCAGTNSAFEASDVAVACKEFRTSNPKDPLVPVVKGFEAWNYLKRGDRETAIAIFNSMLVKGSATDIENAGDKMARSWLSRMDREEVVTALKKIYMRDIEFPASLDALKTLKNVSLPPLTDRWDQPWDYRLDSTIKGMANQRYILESSTLGPRSQLRESLKVSYAEGVDLIPVKMVSATRKVIEFKSDDGITVVRQAGGQSNRINLSYFGTYIIVLSDGSHWSVMAKPR